MTKMCPAGLISAPRKVMPGFMVLAIMKKAGIDRSQPSDTADGRLALPPKPAGVVGAEVGKRHLLGRVKRLLLRLRFLRHLVSPHVEAASAAAFHGNFRRHGLRRLHHGSKVRRLR
jgi:hypothetical protein